MFNKYETGIAILRWEAFCWGIVVGAILVNVVNLVWG